MRHSVLATSLLALSVAACATIGNGPERRAEQRLEAGLAALEQGDFNTARTEINWVAGNHAGTAIGRQALLAAGALEMDPRNPSRRLDLGSGLIAKFLQAPEHTPDWVEPVARTMYLMGLELGSAEHRAAQAEAEKAEAVEEAAQVREQLPKLTTASVASQLRERTEERDKLAKKLEDAEKQVADRDKKLAEKEKELERIKKTLKG